jgi:hypothetical protein
MPRGIGFTRKDRVDYNLTQPGLCLCLPNLQDYLLNISLTASVMGHLAWVFRLSGLMAALCSIFSETRWCGTVTEPHQKWEVYLSRSYHGILDEARIRKHNIESMQNHHYEVKVKLLCIISMY